MLTLRNPTHESTTLAPHPCQEQDQSSILYIPLSYLAGYARLAAPIDGDEEEEPEEGEDYLDQEEEDEEDDEDTYVDKRDEDAQDGNDEVTEEEEDEDDEEDAEDGDRDEDDSDSGTFFLQRPHSLTSDQTIQ